MPAITFTKAQQDIRGKAKPASDEVKALAAKAVKLPKVTQRDKDDYGVKWMAGEYTDPKNPEVQKLVLEARKLGAGWRTIWVEFGFRTERDAAAAAKPVTKAPAKVAAKVA